MTSDIHIRNWMMELAEKLIPAFKQRIQDDEGMYARHISVHDLEVSYEVVGGGDVFEFDVSIHYLSDAGDFTQEVLIRYFESINNYALEASQYDQLVARTTPFENIEPVELMVRDDEERVLLYLAPKGVDIRDLGLKDDVLYFQLGNLLGILHGGESSELVQLKYKELAKYLISHLGFDEETQMMLLSGIESEFSLLDNSYAGYEPVSVIDLNHIRFTPLDDQITKSKIQQDSAFYIEILPSLMAEIQMDRMEDFATLFYQQAYVEYAKTGDVTTTILNLVSIMEGYEGYFEKYSTAPMDRIYPHGLSLDLHMILGIWIHAFHTIQNDEEIDIDRLKSYSLFILENNPFQLYD